VPGDNKGFSGNISVMVKNITTNGRNVLSVIEFSAGFIHFYHE
jgi:hypothetical protein